MFNLRRSQSSSFQISLPIECAGKKKEKKKKRKKRKKGGKKEKKCRENSRNSGLIWLNLAENQLKSQQHFANLQKFAKFERFLNFDSKFPNVQLALSTGLCRSRQALSNAYLVVKIGFDTAENEPPKV